MTYTLRVGACCRQACDAGPATLNRPSVRMLARAPTSPVGRGVAMDAAIAPQPAEAGARFEIGANNR
ncbi:hypothetical protein EVAR_40879_1 [Eumeta japonica]|uniref:Uncharacterized protein n=1 Tax=Eumeta variegata TaxID=151549 RepID=A0A4C1X8L4_EUMVA|nr:hypothetical protein EVAR_40879_1 [Eumeta japonica]